MMFYLCPIRYTVLDKGNRTMSNVIKHMPSKTPSKEIATAQGSFDLVIATEAEVRGIGMGVFKDGTPFLHQRGLAVLCGVENAHIGTISSQWNEPDQKPRINAIKDLLATRGVTVDSPHVEATHKGRKIYAYTDAVCLAILEYYAFEAGANAKVDALKNFRALAGNGLHDFIYAQCRYDPNKSVPEAWRQFHDRVSLVFNSCPVGYFSVFKEIADMIVHLGQHGLHIDDKFIPDISVGNVWAKHWADSDFDPRFGLRRKYDHNYPEYFPQSLSNPQPAWCYPESALGEFKKWFRENYVGQGKFKNYIEGKVKQLQLPASFAALAIASYSNAIAPPSSQSPALR
jgi:hypothetical protein